MQAVSEHEKVMVKKLEAKLSQAPDTTEMQTKMLRYKSKVRHMPHMVLSDKSSAASLRAVQGPQHHHCPQ